MERSAYYSALPTVYVDDEALPIRDKVLAMTAEETAEGLYRCEITLVNQGPRDGVDGFLFLDRRTFDFGKTIKVEIGDRDASGIVFEGRITGLEARYPSQRPPEVCILAEDRLQDLRMTRRTRVFEDASDEDVIREIASDHNLTPRLDMDGSATRPAIAQLNQSDLAFLRDRARAVDAELWVEGDELHCVARSRRNAGEVPLVFNQRLKEFSVMADLAGQSTRTKVAGWDYNSKEPIEAEAGDSAIRSELEAGHSGGATVLQGAFGEREDQVVHLVPHDDGEAATLAESRFRRRARRFVTGRGTAEGDARIRVGSWLDLAGLGGLFSGRYYVCETRHAFGLEEGYEVHFRVERPGIGEAD